MSKLKSTLIYLVSDFYMNFCLLLKLLAQTYILPLCFILQADSMISEPVYLTQLC